MWSLSWLGEERQVAAGLTLLLLYLLWRRQHFSALCVTLLMPGIGVMKKLTSAFVERQRPNYWFQHETSDLGYPAGDVMNAVVLAGLCLILAWPRLRARWERALWALGGVLVVLATGFSRVYVSAHWLTDNLAGFLMGTTWVALGVPVIRWMFPRCRDVVRHANRKTERRTDLGGAVLTPERAAPPSLFRPPDRAEPRR
jgi:undecaprenyl-diphosphatase